MAEGNWNNSRNVVLSAPFSEYISDCNDLKSAGVFKGNSSSLIHTQNLPDTGYYAILVIVYTEGLDLAQMAYEINTAKIYCRAYHDGSTWTEWKRLDNV